MKILDFLSPKNVTLELQARDKKGAITELIELLCKDKKVKDIHKLINAVMEREKLGTTGVGQGVAMPHGRTDAVTELVGAFGISRAGVQFESLDGEPVNLIFLLLSPSDSTGQHLRALARVSRLFKDRFCRQALLDARSVDELIKIIKQEDEY
ncbi:MAG: PTS sugar transporter subunit IIA [Elusimicrobiota bacterium]